MVPVSRSSARDESREPLEIFRALPGEMAIRDAQDLMAYPFFSLAKSKRVVPIDFRAGELTVRVEGTVEHGLATRPDLERLAQAWRRWAASEDGWLLIPHGEILCQVPV